MPATNTLTAGLDRTLYIGELPATDWHRHASPVLLVGLSGRFALRLGGGEVVSCHSALVDMGVDHVFDPCGERVAITYLEPDSPEARRLRGTFRQQGPIIFDPAVSVVARSTFERHLQNFDLQSLLIPCLRKLASPGMEKWRDLLLEGDLSSPLEHGLDARVMHSLRSIRSTRDAPVERDMLARGVHLSASRFNHLFRSEMGVSFRDYRVWTQVRLAILGFRPNGSLTDAALNGAFSDSSHFSRIFRQTFGMTPSSVLKPLKQITLLT